MDEEKGSSRAAFECGFADDLEHPAILVATVFVVRNRAPQHRFGRNKRKDPTQKEVRARINPGPYRYDEDLLSPLARYLTATTSPRWETYASNRILLEDQPVP